MKKLLLSSALVAGLAFANAHAAQAQSEITLLAPGSIRVLRDLVPRFEQKTGHKVKMTFGSGDGTKQQIARGEMFDVSVLQPPYPDVLSSGHVLTNSATPLATVAIGLVVRKGAPKPDISTPEALKRTLLAAKSVSFSDPKGAASGVRILEAFKTLGIADQMQPKIKLAESAPLEPVANGEVDFGLTFMVDMNEPGIDVVGTLPREVCPPTGFVGFLSPHAKDAAVAKALLEFLSSAEVAPAYVAAGMQPGS
jgi:molybdate transport system substrate-binding protein